MNEKPVLLLLSLNIDLFYNYIFVRHTNYLWHSCFSRLHKINSLSQENYSLIIDYHVLLNTPFTYLF